MFHVLLETRGILVLLAGVQFSFAGHVFVLLGQIPQSDRQPGPRPSVDAQCNYNPFLRGGEILVP